MGLQAYRSKRDFKKTSEPAPRLGHSEANLKFCIQKHAASHLHYDFRLEHYGVLVSWAVPKGPSLDPKLKRLAIKVEDHPYDYRDFEGIIPEGNYGAGTVMVWDEGYYTVPHAENRKESEKRVEEGLAKGHLEIYLHGTKLQGAFSLIKLKQTDKDNQWLLVKKNDEYASTKEITSLDISAKTNRSLDEIAVKPLKKKVEKSRVPSEKSFDKIPKNITPMLAQLIDKPFDKENWLFEIKWDGYRALAYIENGQIDLLSRNQNSFSATFPLLIKELKKIKDNCLLDGEIVLLDEKGKSQFQLMQNYQRNKEGVLRYLVFDILYLNGKDLRNNPLVERKELLKEILARLPENSPIKYSDHVEEKGIAFFKEASKKHLEGIIGKNGQSSYQSKRSGDWVKIKTSLRQEAVIGGFTDPQGARKHFGALLIGLYQGKDLHYAGKVGGGFNRKLLEDVYKKLEPLIQKECPFTNISKAQSKATWVSPKLVCEISFSEWTKDGLARQPIFQGLRLDKDPKEVIKEVPVHLPEKEKNEEKKKAPTKKNQKVELTHLDKIYWPEENYTKGDLINYYKEISPFIIPYLKNRPIVLRRFPEGIKGGDFFQKEIGNIAPDWLETTKVQHEDKIIKYMLINDLNSLLFAVNLGSIEINPFSSQIKSLEYPDYAVIDLDPGDVPFEKVVETALITHQILDEMGMKNYCKTSGGRGLHIYIPVHAKYDYEQVKQFAEIIALCVHKKLPKYTSLERSPKKREKKIYLDYLQNRSMQTIVAAYSARPRALATVSTPLTWDEVENGLDPKSFTIKTVPERVKRIGDIFKPILGSGVDVQKGLKNLQKSLKSIK